MNVMEQAARQQQVVKEIRKRFSDVQFPNVRRENLYYGMPKKDNYLEGFQALLGDENKVFSFVSDSYTLVRNEVVANKVLRSLKNFKQTPTISFRFPNDGAKMVMRVDFESEFKKLNRFGDKISPAFILKNSYDKQWNMSLAYGAKELVCSNGMTVFKMDSVTKKKHIGTNINVEMLMEDESDIFTDKVAEFLDSFKLQIDKYKSWGEIHIPAGSYHEEIKPQMPFNKTENEKLEEMPIIGRKFTLKDLLAKDKLTLWETNRIMTQFTTHELESPTKAVAYEEAIAKELDKVYSKYAQ